MRLNRLRLCGALPSLLVLTLLGCANDTIRLRNNDSVAPAGRVLWHVVQPQGNEERIFSSTGLTLEGEVAYIEGKDNQTVATGNKVDLDRTTVNGPSDVRSRAQVVDVTLDARTGLAIADLLRLEVIAGFEFVSLDMEVAGAGIQASDWVPSFGVVVGARAGLQPHELIEFYAQWVVGALAGTRGENISLETSKAEVGARFLPLDHFGVFAGYRWSGYRQVRNVKESDADLRFRGPVLGAELRF